MDKKVIILAAGCGTRMRQANEDVSLTGQQAEMAEQGLKALIPIGRPFLEYSLASIAEAGYRQVCLVTSPRQDQLREYCDQLNSERLQIEYVIQQEQFGTANALAAAENFAGEDLVLVLNGDNYYPAASLRHLLGVEGNSLIGFEYQGLVENSNISADRIDAYSVIQKDGNGNLSRIVEKPDAAFVAQLADPILISMNCWRFGPAIFEACRKIDPSPRGEYEIPDAAIFTIREMGELYRVVHSSEGVLDLSSRSDIAGVTKRLAGIEVRL